uniref:Uncharacterized protein n=1 Tax=Anguilla anguilla TaxID=7936 RepID=A0A0E9U5G0_ANGAN
MYMLCYGEITHKNTIRSLVSNMP